MLPKRLVGQPDASLVRTLQAEGHEALLSARQLARFLCGISSPRSSRARLARHPAFGALVDTPFVEVLRCCG